MHNPAWRPARLQTERLASIQHHFIDKDPVVHSAGKPLATHCLLYTSDAADECPAV